MCDRLSRLLIVLTICFGTPARSEDAATPAPQGTEHHYCLPDATLYRRAGFFFCATHPPAAETVRTLAVVGPDRAGVMRALLDAFAWARPASSFTEAHAAEPDIVFVATSPRFSGETVLADLAAQGFVLGPDLRSMIAILDTNNRDGSSSGGELSRTGPNGRPLVVTWQRDDHLSEGAARNFIAEQLGVSHLLVSPPVKVGGGDYDDRYDTRTFVPVAAPGP